jgi:hypothetical protein
MKFSTSIMLFSLEGGSALQLAFVARSGQTVVSRAPKSTSSLNMVDGESRYATFWGTIFFLSRIYLTFKCRNRTKHLTGNMAAGVAIGVAGFAAGIGMVAFAEAQVSTFQELCNARGRSFELINHIRFFIPQGERAKERGGGLSESMSTQLSGMLMEDVEVSSVEDLGSLTNQLEAALKASGGTTDEELVMTEEDKKRLQEEADDGW